jgi:hypothetical protein
MDHGIKLSKIQAPQDEQEQKIMQTLPYRNLTGALLYVANTTRPDIMFAVNKCAQFMSNPGTKHWEALLNILVYLKTNNKLMIKYSRNIMERNILSAYVDADHGGDVDTKRSTTGYTVFMNDGPIRWTTKLQEEASGGGSGMSEYKAIYLVANEIVWLRNIFEELGMKLQDPTEVREDSEAAINHAHNPVNMSRMKGIEIKYHATRDIMAKGHLYLRHISTSEQIADILTKALQVRPFLQFRQRLLVEPEDDGENQRKGLKRVKIAE